MANARSTLLTAQSLDSADASHTHLPSVDPEKQPLGVPARCDGTQGNAQVLSDGGFVFSVEKGTGATGCLPCGWQNAALQLAAQDIVGATVRKSTSFIVWYCPAKALKPGQSIRKLRKSPAYQCSSAAEAENIVQRLRSAAAWKGAAQPRRIVAIVNPKSGQGKSAKNFAKVVQPIFDAAGLVVIVHQTQHAGHATELAQQLDLAGCDALVMVGGDGTVFEALQGYFKRPDWQQAVKLPFALLPSGSGNALAANTGCWDLVTAAHAVCKGVEAPLDIVSVLQPSPTPRRFYSFLSLTYGMIASLDIGTESLRWMGGLRFTYGAFFQIMKRQAWDIRAAILPASNAAASTSPPDSSGTADNAHSVEEVSRAQGWRGLGADRVQLFAACNLPFLDLHFKIAPEAGLNTGAMSVIHTPRSTRAQGFHMMYRAELGTHMELGRVQHEKVVAMVLEPVSKDTWLVLDGEVIPSERIFAEVHRGLCRVLVA
ncbi:hypothetical protein WJX72_003548 [[Myrmecia] bisecta]|uniref:DAGKc domain-containing protein n=1 Tax=[Myrmecia] bisecta TaxID=41462 RepID=A0AAW1PAS9_9CHLO